MAGVYHDLYVRLSAYQDNLLGPDLGAAARLAKLSEEVGEVQQAYIGFLGANKRKGSYATEDDVAAELCDVVITAMVALHDWHDQPEALLKAKIQKLKERMEVEGS